MKVRPVILLVFSVLTASVQGCAQDAYKPKPLPKGDKVHTEKEFMQTVERFRHRTIVEEFQKHGPHDAKWNDQAVRFLEAYAKTGTTVGDSYKLGKEAYDLGCADPLFLGCYGKILMANKKSAEAEPILRQALDGLQKSTYHKCRAVPIPGDLVRILNNRGIGQNGQEGKDLLKLGIDLMVRSTSDGSYLPGEQSIMLFNFEQIFVGQFPRQYMDFFRMIAEAKRADPYFQGVITGMYEWKLAFEARGYGFADTVTPKAWQGFEEHGMKARKALIDAWKLRPELPEAPSQMINVANGGFDPDDSPRLWFDRTVANRFDYLQAYECYRIAARPRWGGTLDEMFKFAMECLNTGRFDTNVPVEYFRTLRAITADVDIDGDASYWHKPEVFLGLKTLWEGYGKAGVYTPDQLKTLQAASLWQCTRYEEAKTALEQLGDKADTKLAQDQFKVSYARMLQDSRVLGGDCGRDMIKAWDLYTKGKKTESLAIYKAVLEKTKDATYTGPAAQYYISTIENENKFAKGDWVDLAPPDDWSGWCRNGGQWSFKDGVIQLKTNEKDDNELFCNSSFGKYFEVQGEIEVIAAEHWSFDGGIIFNLPNMTNICVVFHPKFDELEIGLMFNTDEKVTHAGITPNCPFLIQYRDTEITVYVNGEMKTKWLPRMANYTPPAPFIGIGGTYDGIVRVKNLQVRKLPEKPE